MPVHRPQRGRGAGLRVGPACRAGPRSTKDKPSARTVSTRAATGREERVGLIVAGSLRDPRPVRIDGDRRKNVDRTFELRSRSDRATIKTTRSAARRPARERRPTALRPRLRRAQPVPQTRAFRRTRSEPCWAHGERGPSDGPGELQAGKRRRSTPPSHVRRRVPVFTETVSRPLSNEEKKQRGVWRSGNSPGR